MAKILKEMMSQLEGADISDAAFEASNIVFYTKNKQYLFSATSDIKALVQSFKKRVELRPDPSITMDMEKAEAEIRKMVPEEVEIGQILFDPQRSIVIIEADKPGLVIGKGGELLQEIKRKTLWVPQVRRKPSQKSTIIDSIRGILYQESDYRRKFLHKQGVRIYDEWIRERKAEWVRVSYLGAGRHVGRSCLLLQTEESRVLLDCGIDISNAQEPYPMLECPEFRIEELDAIVLSHAHLDHCGFIPYLYKMGFKGPVYCTEPTRDTSALLLIDAMKISRHDGKEPLYDVEHVKEMMKHTITLSYEEVSDITPDIRITLYNAGHTLGSSMIHLHIGNGLHNLLYTADIKYGRTEVLDPAVTKFPRVESMILEATYGGKDNVLIGKEDNDDMLIEKIKEVIGRGGKMLLPVLGTGRAQEIMVVIEQAMKDGKLENIPVYVDGMVWDVTAIHTAYPEFLNAKIRKRIFQKDDNPFENPVLRKVGSSKERKQIVEEEGACVILATSGMLTGGPSVEYLKQIGGHSRNALIFVSYQGEGSLGKRIQRGEREFVFGNGMGKEILQMRCEVATFEGFSGHSDRKQLMNFVAKCDPRPKKIMLCHGEQSRCLDLASGIYKTYRIETSAPRNLDAIRLR
jgi:uncharacterized protein